MERTIFVRNNGRAQRAELGSTIRIGVDEPGRSPFGSSFVVQALQDAHFDLGYSYPNMGYSFPNLGYSYLKLGYISPNIGYMFPNMGCASPNMGYSFPDLGNEYPMSNIAIRDACIAQLRLFLTLLRRFYLRIKGRYRKR